MTKVQTKRWALLAATAYRQGRIATAGDILAVFLPDAAEAGKSAEHQLDSDEGVMVEDLREILDEVGFQSILKVAEDRRKELERLQPSIHMNDITAVSSTR